MERISVNLRHCYGIKALKHDFDFSNTRVFAIYAPNGAMKSSLALTFKDLSNGQQPKDRIFPDRVTVAEVTDENGADVENDRVFVVLSYDEEFGPSEKTCTLLVDPKLRSEFAELQVRVDEAKQALLSLLKQQSKSRENLESEISLAITKTHNEFRRALIRIKDEVQEQPDAPFANVEYDKIFANAIITVLNTKDLKELILEYITRYDELLAASTFFKKGIFDYFNAAQVADSLAKNGFFSASHSVNLKSAGETLEINTQAELAQVIDREKEAILKDKKLIKTFDAVQAQLSKNAGLREFRNYLMENMSLLPHLSNIDKLREDVIKSYIKAHEDAYINLLKTYEKVREREEIIFAEAEKQKTQWERVIDIFNRRFNVPFTLHINNKIDVMIGNARIMELGFTYNDGEDSTEIQRDELLNYLSSGEKKAFYILNVIFEVERRIKDQQETLVIVDDLADSFDYQNKYAIVEYLRDISDEGVFKQIILTHNFDFLRTIQSRFVSYASCLMALKSDAGITLVQAEGVRNIFVNDWKVHFFDNDRKKIASIAFLRNLVEFSRGDKEPAYLKLTSMLHWKPDSPSMTVADLDIIFNTQCNMAGVSADPERTIIELIDTAADGCLDAAPGLNLENKVVLSIATRLRAERFIVDKLNDAAFLAGIDRNQTQRLITKFKKEFSAEINTAAVLDRVALMTPENIHLNSFMYEPIIDMGEDHLRELYGDVKALQ
ncbi:MAG: phage infection protein [Proteobacteria bacterium]|nr:phage infection protein [Pseudomonadota bacterium]